MKLEGKLKAKARKSPMLEDRLYSIGHEELWKIYSQGSEVSNFCP